MPVASYAHACICTLHCNKHKSTTPFGVATGYVQAWRGVRDITSQQLCALVCMCAGMMEHSVTINSVIQDHHVYIDGWDTPAGKIP